MNSNVSLGLSGFYYDGGTTSGTRSGSAAASPGLPVHARPVRQRRLPRREGQHLRPDRAYAPASPSWTTPWATTASTASEAGLSHDTRDSTFLATEGHLIELSFEQVVGTFSYPRVDIDVRKYFLLHQRPDGSGRHVLSLCRAVRLDRRRHADLRPLLRRRLFDAARLRLPRGLAARSATGRRRRRRVASCWPRPSTCSRSRPTTCSAAWSSATRARSRRTIDDWQRQVPRRPGLRPADHDPGHGPRARSPWTSPSPSPASPATTSEVFSFFVGFNH